MNDTGGPRAGWLFVSRILIAWQVPAAWFAGSSEHRRNKSANLASLPFDLFSPVLFWCTFRFIFSDLMCFYHQTLWACGHWKWGRFSTQCTKEHRIGETCGLKLIWATETRREVCKVCALVAKKRDRVKKMVCNIERWKFEGHRTATIEKTKQDLSRIQQAIGRLLSRNQTQMRGADSRLSQPAATEDMLPPMSYLGLRETAPFTKEHDCSAIACLSIPSSRHGSQVEGNTAL